MSSFARVGFRSFRGARTTLRSDYAFGFRPTGQGAFSRSPNFQRFSGTRARSSLGMLGQSRVHNSLVRDVKVCDVFVIWSPWSLLQCLSLLRCRFRSLLDRSSCYGGLLLWFRWSSLFCVINASNALLVFDCKNSVRSPTSPALPAYSDLGGFLLSRLGWLMMTREYSAHNTYLVVICLFFRYRCYNWVLISLHVDVGVSIICPLFFTHYLYRR